MLAVALLAPGTESAAAASGCAGTSAHREVAPVVSYDPQPSAPRVFAMQFRQDPRNVVSYSTFKRKVDCLLRADVVPRLAHGRPNLVVFTEDIGLMTGATGTRGATARALWSKGGDASGCAGMPSPCQALAGLSALGDAYAPQVAAYHQRFPDLPPLADDFVAATDTFARGWMSTFSALARKYRIYLVGSGTQARFRKTTDPAEVAQFADPDVPHPTFAYVATGPQVYNEVFLWGPRGGRSWPPTARCRSRRSSRRSRSRRGRPPARRRSPTCGRSACPGRARGSASPPACPRSPTATRPRARPCSDTSLYYMRCLDKLGANLVVQDEANPGAWTGPDGDGVEQWQPLSWMTSTWRAVTDPPSGSPTTSPRC